VRPTSDDIRIAKTNAETELKRADLEYRKREDERRLPTVKVKIDRAKDLTVKAGG